MLLLNPAPATRAQDFRDQGTYAISTDAPYVAAVYPDSTQALVDGIVTNAFLTQRGTRSSSSGTLQPVNFERKVCGRPRRKKRLTAAQQSAQSTVAVPAQPTIPTPINNVPWWLIGIGAFVLLVGLPGGGEA